MTSAARHVRERTDSFPSLELWFGELLVAQALRRRRQRAAAALAIGVLLLASVLLISHHAPL